nr:MAG TPA: hypothetical protein [Caudoviricetes sp.]
MAQQTIVTIDMDKESLQLAATAIIEHLSLYPPTEEDHTIEYSLGLQALFDCLKATFKS